MAVKLLTYPGGLLLRRVTPLLKQEGYAGRQRSQTIMIASYAFTVS